jgi:membrane associated rhomboid family serine protease
LANANPLLETVLRECQKKAPAPFYPSLDGKDKGLDRMALDEALDQLRLGGLVELTPWEAGRGQGYRLTAEGEQILRSPRQLGRLQTHGVEAKPVAPPLAPPAPSVESTTWQRGEAVRAILLGGVTPFVTMTLILINVFMFFLGLSIAVSNDVPTDAYLAGSDGRVLNLLGSVNRTDVLVEGEWWRLLAHQFVHRGLLHLLLNMLFVYNVGRIMETLWRHGRFTLLYLIAGVGGGTAVLLTHTAAVGASGALCGIFASLIVFILWNREYLPPQFVASLLRQLFLNAVVIIIISTLPGVSGAGHLGGAVAGAAVSIPLMYTLFGKGVQRWLGWLGVLAVPLVCLAVIAGSMTERDRAARVQEIVSRATRPAFDAYNDHIRELIYRPHMVLGDAEKKSAAELALTEAEEHIRAGAARLDELAEFTQQSMQASLLEVKEYMRGWRVLLQACRERLRSTNVVDIQKTLELDKQARFVIGLREKLLKSTDLVN